MEFFTLNRKFLREEAIDTFISGIWTERYYGDSEFELIVPATKDMVRLLPEGTFMGVNDSKEVMIIETVDIEKGQLKVAGFSLLKWLNNRFLRATANPKDRYWNANGAPGWIIWAIIYWWCIDGEFLNGVWPMGIANPERFKIPGLTLKGYDTSGPVVDVAIPYGPVYDAMKTVAMAYEIGMTITLESATDTGYSLQFLNYRGLDRTSRQSVTPVIRFSPDMDNLINIKELHSIQNVKNLVFSFGPELANVPGVAPLNLRNIAAMTPPAGFDLRALMTFEDDMQDQFGANEVMTVLNSRAQTALDNSKPVRTIDGEIVPNFQVKYGKDYYLGDLIEVQGYSEIIQVSRVTEYIRAQDDTGERAYPTVAMLE